MSSFGDFFVDAGSTALQKLVISSHKVDEDTNPSVQNNRTASKTGSFVAFYNPNTFSSEYAIEYDEEMPIGDLKVSANFKKYTATTYSFSLVFDGTGASLPVGFTLEDGKSPSSIVPDMVQRFKEVAYYYDGEIHRPKFLSISWGAQFVPRCVLTGFSLSYDLFNADGVPLRATVAAKFKEYGYRELTDAEKKNMSPDLTHVRVVQQGDRLPLMCEKIYGDGSLYLQVARFNKIANYRNLVPGQKIYFPPLTKAKS